MINRNGASDNGYSIVSDFADIVERDDFLALKTTYVLKKIFFNPKGMICMKLSRNSIFSIISVLTAVISAGVVMTLLSGCGDNPDNSSETEATTFSASSTAPETASAQSTITTAPTESTKPSEKNEQSSITEPMVIQESKSDSDNDQDAAKQNDDVQTYEDVRRDTDTKENAQSVQSVKSVNAASPEKKDEAVDTYAGFTEQEAVSEALKQVDSSYRCYRSSRSTYHNTNVWAIYMTNDGEGRDYICYIGSNMLHLEFDGPPLEMNMVRGDSMENGK